MTTCLAKSCSFGLPQVPFVNCCQFMYLVISLLVLRAGCGIWLYRFLIIAYLFTFSWLCCLQRFHVNKTTLEIWAMSWEKLFQPYGNNKGADQPVHPRSLISTFVVRCIDSIIPILLNPKFQDSSFKSLWLRRTVCVLPGGKPRR